MKITVVKYHAQGNDYLVYDPNNNEMELSKNQICMLCDRHRGAGADGVLVGPIFNGVSREVLVHIYNPDGSLAEISGNGISIFAKYLKDSDYVQKDHIKFWTTCREVEAFYLNEEGTRLKISIGKISFWSDDIPVVGPRREVIEEDMEFGGITYQVTCVSVGNPHCIIPMRDVTKSLVCQIGRFSENAPYFPNKVNTQLLKVIDRTNIAIETYERGAGYTLAAGSNACAAAAVANRLGMADEKMYVHMPGGIVEVEIMENGYVFMTGEVAKIGKMTLSHEFTEKLRSCQ